MAVESALSPEETEEALEAATEFSNSLRIYLQEWLSKSLDE
jgi:hypothetical protein